MSWHYLQAQEAVSSEDIYWDGEQFAPSKSKTILGEYCLPDRQTDACQDSQSGTMSPPSTDDPGAGEWMLSRADFRARTSAQPGKVQESPDPEVGYGLTWPASSAKFDRDTSSWKIHPCLFPEEQMLCSVALPRWGMMRHGELSEHSTPEHLTSGTGFGLWPTPTRSMYKSAAGCSQEYIDRRRSRGLIDLAEAVVDKKRDPQPTGGSLNPTWVEWLMGWPVEWTDLKPLATAKFQQWKRSHSLSCPNDYEETATDE